MIRNMSKKLYIVLFIAIAANSVIASTNKLEKCKEAAITCYALPVLIPVMKKDGESIPLASLIEAKVGKKFPKFGKAATLIMPGVVYLAIIGGVTAGVVAAVKFYKKKQADKVTKQSVNEHLLV